MLTGLDLAVDPGHRLGVVGENGVGKSTLLRLLAGVEDADDLERAAAAMAATPPDDAVAAHGAPLTAAPPMATENAYAAALLRAELPGAVVLTSHDRVFLDEVCTEILDLDPAIDGPTGYGGTFRDYLRAKRTERARWEQRWQAEREELAALGPRWR